jgi:GTP diphosphokinase / guanosine-3',5'-bis(diphosphate) 3'-diphosphatase
MDDDSLIDRFIKRARKSSKGIRVAGLDNVMIAFGKCCNPVPGEPITGIVTRGRGIVVHTNSCKNLISLMQDPDRIIEVSWDVDNGSRFLAGLYILGERRTNFLSEISDAVTNSDGLIINVNMNSEDSLVNCVLSIEVYDLNHLKKVITKLNKLDGIISVGRLNE